MVPAAELRSRVVAIVAETAARGEMNAAKLPNEYQQRHDSDHSGHSLSTLVKFHDYKNLGAFLDSCPKLKRIVHAGGNQSVSYLQSEDLSSEEHEAPEPEVEPAVQQLEKSSRPERTIGDVLERKRPVEAITIQIGVAAGAGTEPNSPQMLQPRSSVQPAYSRDFQEGLAEVMHHGGSGIARSARPSMASHHCLGSCVEAGLFGVLPVGRGDGNRDRIYLNVNEPFCLIAMGVQGGGKSHTLSVVLENCMLPCPVPESEPLISLQTPMSCLVFHYDQSENSVCEATGLIEMSAKIDKLLTDHHHVANGGGGSGGGGGGEWAGKPLCLSRVVVLVSPTFYEQRKHFYSSSAEYEVLPLLFQWSALSAVQLKKLMRINDGDNQLYVGLMLAKLRQYQRQGGVPKFGEFCAEIMDACAASPGQSNPLQQRLEVLRQFVAESEENKAVRARQRDLADLVASGTLVVADMTDPMLAPAEANGIFQVLLEQFRLKELSCGKVVVCDEAHKYFDSKAKGGDGLAGAIVETVRLMRHEGMRVVVSTQSPLTMPPELLELSTIAVCHKFHSADWYDYLSKKLPLPTDGFATIQSLEPGNALVFASRLQQRKFRAAAGGGQLHDEDDCGPRCEEMRVRPRLTADRGGSRRNEYDGVGSMTL
jgi:hypothetical protein